METPITIKVAVGGSDANGSPDIVIYEVQCTQSGYDNGEHYAKAKEMAEAEGYEPAFAFDENDPAWRKLS